MRRFGLHAILPWLIGIGLLLSVGCPLAALSLGLALRHEAAANAVRRATEAANALTHRIESDLAVFDLALRQAGQPPAHGRIAPIAHPLIGPYVAFLDVLDADGAVIGSSRTLWNKGENFAGRDYFRDQKSAPSAEPRIGRPYDDGRAIPISRRLETPDGRFDGVVVAGVQLVWLRDLLAHAALPPWVSVAIRREDGSTLVRSPADPDGTVRLESAADPLWRAWRESGTSPAPLDDGTARAFRALVPSPWTLDMTVDGEAAGLASVPSPIGFLLPSLLPGLAALSLSALSLRFRGRARRTEIEGAKANDERMRLLADISHELRTPLTAMLAEAELLRDEGGLGSRQSERLERLTVCGDAMRRVVDRVTDTVRPEEQEIEPILERCDLDQMVREMRGTVEAFARKKGLRLTTYVDPSVPSHAVLDRGLVTRVLANLLTNAVKYTADGAIDLRVTAGASRLRFEVADTGPGVARPVWDRLFRPYDRLGIGETGEAGTGLGLAISRRLVHCMGGEIGQHDNQGGGSVFWFALPFGTAVELPRDGSPPPEAATLVRASLRILLADDIDATRRVTADFLRQAGHEVTETADGEAALRAAETAVFDLVVTDMRMPIHDGIEVACRIRRLPGERGRVPVILLTADLAAPRSDAARDAGIDVFLRKPFKRAELLEAVATAARLAPPGAAPGGPLLDDAALRQLLESMGREALDMHLAAAARRIEGLLASLARPPAGAETRAEVHDLVGITGLLGMALLSEALRRFDLTPDEADLAAALAHAARETLAALRAHQPAPLG